MLDLPENVDPDRFARLMRLAREEDLGTPGDITSSLLPTASPELRVAIVARESGVFAGAGILRALVDVLCGDNVVTLSRLLADGADMRNGTCVASLRGPAGALLSVERTILNVLQRLSGVATLTRRFVDTVSGTKARIFDTRKTIPAWRDLDKYAVRCGGGYNHRHGLHDAVLIKDNHLANIEPGRLAEWLTARIESAASLQPPPTFVEVEVDSLEQFNIILAVRGVDVILLDNFSLVDSRRAVALRDAAGLADAVQLEASGGIGLQSVADVAQTGVDRIAVGAITHSAPAVDLGMDLIE